MRLVLTLVVALALPPVAAASERHPTLGDLEGEVICPTCHTTLDQSSSPIATRMKAFIAARIRAGDTKSEIEQKLVAQFGPGVLARPSKHGLDLFAWLLPLAVLVVGAAGLGAAIWKWRGSAREPARPSPAPLDPDVEQRIDEELARFEA
jgi:cytochrome c-type biogenesis protein CcmH